MESKIDVKDGYIYLKFSGYGNPTEIKKVLYETRQQCNRLHNSNVMIDFLDFNFENINKTKRIVFAMTLFDTFKHLPNARIASIMNEDVYDKMLETYTEMTFFGYNVFLSRDKALDWFNDES